MGLSKSCEFDSPTIILLNSKSLCFWVLYKLHPAYELKEDMISKTYVYRKFQVKKSISFCQSTKEKIRSSFRRQVRHICFHILVLPFVFLQNFSQAWFLWKAFFQKWSSCGNTKGACSKRHDFCNHLADFPKTKDLSLLSVLIAANLLIYSCSLSYFQRRMHSWECSGKILKWTDGMLKLYSFICLFWKTVNNSSNILKLNKIAFLLIWWLKNSWNLISIMEWSEYLVINDIIQDTIMQLASSILTKIALFLLDTIV